MKSMMGEITDSTNRAQGFALLPFTYSMGSTIGYALATSNLRRSLKLTLIVHFSVDPSHDLKISSRDSLRVSSGRIIRTSCLVPHRRCSLSRASW
jgi:hypothetical protein